MLLSNLQDRVIDQLFRRQQAQPNPISAEDFEKLEKHTVGQDQVNAEMSCSVCIERYNVGDTTVTLPCSHAFHIDCAKPWLLEQQNTCPLCRQTAKDESDDDDESSETDSSEDDGVDDGEIQVNKKQRRH